MRRRGWIWLTAISLAAVLTASCIDVHLGDGGSLFPEPSFIISGTVELDAGEPLCSRFQADNGLTYHLFQGPRLTNDEYDQLFEDGARARLEIEIRDDLVLECEEGELVEVVEVLEFIPADRNE